MTPSHYLNASRLCYIGLLLALVAPEVTQGLMPTFTATISGLLLLCFAPSQITGHRMGLVWMCFLLLLLFIHATMLAFSEKYALLGGIQIAFIVGLFSLTLTYLRTSRK